MDSEGFSVAELNTNRNTKRKPVRPHTEERTRYTHAVYPLTRASALLGVGMDEPTDPDGLGEVR